MDIWNDFRKVKRQLFCQENIFGYKTTSANQLYAFYCILSFERYLTNEFHMYTKIFFIFWHIVGLLIPVFMLSTYILFYEKNDLILLLYILFPIGSFAFMRMFVPFWLYWYANDFKRIINEVDENFRDEREDLSKLSNTIDMKSTAVNNIVFLSIFEIAFASITSLDVLFFYDEKKLKDYSYYVFTLPKIDRYGNLWIFLSANGCAFISIVSFIFELFALFGILTMFMAICHNEVILICHLMKQTSTFVENTTHRKHISICQSKIEQKAVECLRKTLITGVVSYQKVIRIVTCFKRFYTTLTLIALPTIYIFLVCNVYAILTVSYIFFSSYPNHT